MGNGTAVCSHDVRSFSCTAHRTSGPVRHSPPSMHGEDRNNPAEEENLDISLYSIRSLEHLHDVLGMQCNSRRRYICHSCKLSANVACLRTLPSEQKEIQRHPSIHLPHAHMDSMGKILFRR